MARAQTRARGLREHDPGTSAERGRDRGEDERSLAKTLEQGRQQQHAGEPECDEERLAEASAWIRVMSRAREQHDAGHDGPRSAPNVAGDEQRRERDDPGEERQIEARFPGLDLERTRWLPWFS